MKSIILIAILCLFPVLTFAQKGEGYYKQYYSEIYNIAKGKGSISKARSFLSKAANAGYAEAQYDLGKRYARGLGEEQDYKKAVEWFQKAADQGHENATYELAYMYEHGEGVPFNDNKAAELYISIAEKGHKEAIMTLANKYFHSNRDKAIEWWRKGASLGYGDAMYYLGMVYEGGYGVDQDYKIAEEWYDKAKMNRPSDYTKVSFALSGIRKKIEEQKSRKISVDLRQQEETKNITVARIGSDVDKDIPVAKQTQDKTFALIIANENYDGVVPVPYAKNDATTFEMYCRQTLGIPGDNIHTLKDATYGQMKRGVVWLQDIIKAYQGEAQVIVYYAGHGIPDEKSRAGYLLPTDGNPMNPASAYALEDLYKELVEQPSRSIVVLLDACFSGTKREGAMLTSARGVAIKVKPEQPAGNLVVFSATQGDETAYAYDEQKHGLFTYYMLKKMKETNGSLTLGELSDFVRQQVMQQSVKYNGKLQTPTVTSPSSLGDIWKTLKLIP